MSNLHRGSCLCGAVRFTLDGTFERFYLCHCEYCRKDTGSAHAANLFSPTARLEWIAGADRISTYQLPQTRHTRCFCSICGSAMPVVTATMVVVPAGCLETDPSRRPDAHIFISSRAPWDHDLATLPVFETFPS